MRRKKKLLFSLLMLMLVFVWGLSAGCRPETESAGGGTVSISIVDVSADSTDTEQGLEESGTEPARSDRAAETGPEEEGEETPGDQEAAAEPKESDRDMQRYYFRNARLLAQHYEKHGIEMGFASEEEYEAASSAVISNPNALHKKEKEDNDQVFYVEDTNEFAVLSEDGYIRTYFNPDAGIRYYNRQ